MFRKSLDRSVTRERNGSRRVRVALIACAALAGALVTSGPVEARTPVQPPPEVPPNLPADFYGKLDSVVPAWNGVRVTGWAYVPGQRGADVHVYLDGVGVGLTSSREFRPDVFQAYPELGNYKGYEVTVPAAMGTHEVCAYVIRTNADDNPLLGCQEVTVAGDPVGVLDRLVPAPGGIQVVGWAMEPGSSAKVDVHVYVDDVGVGADQANKPRPDVEEKYPASGDDHGFDLVVPAAKGDHQVCAYGINTEEGGNSLLGCRSITLDGQSFGNLDQIQSFIQGSRGPGGETFSVKVKGWLIKPDHSGVNSVIVQLGGEKVQVLTDRSRPDVAAVYGSYGDLVGFEAEFRAMQGSHDVCVYDDAPGGVLIGCEVIEINSEPRGVLDDVTAVDGAEGSGIRVAGWALQPDRGEPIEVEVDIRNVAKLIVSASKERPDIGLAFPDYGPFHGFDVVIPVMTDRSYSACVTAINAYTGVRNHLGCDSVSLGNPPPLLVE